MYIYLSIERERKSFWLSYIYPKPFVDHTNVLICDYTAWWLNEAN